MEHILSSHDGSVDFGGLDATAGESMAGMRDFGGVGSVETRDLLFLNILPGAPSYYEEVSLKSLLRQLDSMTDERDCYDSGVAEAPYLVSKVNYRDLRRLEYKMYPGEAPCILVRRHCVLFLFDPLRAVVLADRLLLVVPDGADSLLHLLESRVRSCVGAGPLMAGRAGARGHDVDVCESGDSPPSQPASTVGLVESLSDSTVPAVGQVQVAFEVGCYEALLSTVLELHSRAQSLVGKQVSRLLSLYEDASGDESCGSMQGAAAASLLAPSGTCKLLTLGMQREMQRLKNEINGLTRLIQSYRRGLFDSLLAEEDTMALMNLGLLVDSPQCYISPASPFTLSLHEPIEILLEASVMDYNTALNGLDALSTKLVNAEAMTSLQLSVSRNALLALNTKISILGAAMSFGGFIAGVFGMNLSNVESIQPLPHTFEVVSVCLFLLVAIVSAATTWWFTVTGVLPVFNGTK